LGDRSQKNRLVEYATLLFVVSVWSMGLGVTALAMAMSLSSLKDSAIFMIPWACLVAAGMLWSVIIFRKMCRDGRPLQQRFIARNALFIFGAQGALLVAVAGFVVIY
tara:strand:+ start:963 stop:1283 length:321 start_codon:yes stop_codon:yes gene_type:complete